MTVFDDGNLRIQQCSGGHSRGMILSVVEPTRTVWIQLAADLGQYDGALDSAQLLPSSSNSLYASFGSGLLFLPGDSSEAVESDAAGKLVHELQANGWSYRTYRSQDLYTPTLP